MSERCIKILYFNAIEDFEVKDDEILVDGQIYCKCCKTPRTVSDEYFGRTVRCLCKCKAEERDRQIELEKQRQTFEKIKKMRNLSILGSKYENSSFENLDMNRPQVFLDAVTRCRNFCQNWQQIKNLGLGIYLHSEMPGTGKTELTACIANFLTQNLVPVIATNMLEISKKLRASYFNNSEFESEIIKQFTEVDLLILDDLGIEKLAKNGEDTFLQDRLYDIINRRYINKKPTLFTSNFSIKQLVTERGLWLRTADRIQEMSYAILKIECDSYRPKLKQKQKLFF